MANRSTAINSNNGSIEFEIDEKNSFVSFRTIAKSQQYPYRYCSSCLVPEWST